MSLNSFRRFLYRTASLLGDVNAVKKGTIVQRIIRKETYKLASKIINRKIK